MLTEGSDGEDSVRRVREQRKLRAGTRTALLRPREAFAGKAPPPRGRSADPDPAVLLALGRDPRVCDHSPGPHHHVWV